MTALPPKTNFTDSAVTKSGFKAAINQLRDYLSGLLGDDGTAATARTKLGLADVFAVRSNNLSDLTDAATARANLGLSPGLTAVQTLGLGFAATLNHGSGSQLDADLLDGQHGAYYADIPSRLGYTPVRQGGGTGMDASTVHIGWLTTGGLGAQVGATPLGMLWYSGAAPASFSTSGYMRLPNGFTIQWGQLASVGANSGVNVTFPFAYTGLVLGGWASCLNPSNEAEFAGALNIANLVLTGMRVINPDEAVKNVMWFSIGV